MVSRESGQVARFLTGAAPIGRCLQLRDERYVFGRLRQRYAQQKEDDAQRHGNKLAVAPEKRPDIEKRPLQQVKSE